MDISITMLVGQEPEPESSAEKPCLPNFVNQAITDLVLVALDFYLACSAAMPPIIRYKHSVPSLSPQVVKTNHTRQARTVAWQVLNTMSVLSSWA